jgi:hypothetical protein
MRFFMIVVFIAILFTGALFAQNSRAVVSGRVTNYENDVIGDATIEAQNLDTGARYQAAVTPTGNYTLSNLPPGKYQLSTSPKGYKPAILTDIFIATGQVYRIDLIPQHLEADAGEEEAIEGEEVEEPEIAREWSDTGQIADGIDGATLTNAPMLGFADGEGRIRNPLQVLQLTPGSLMTNLEYFRVNGAPSNTESIRIEGQEINNGFLLSNTVHSQVGVDAVKDFSIQSGNYAAEYGQAGGGIVSIAMKSGTNSYHGSVYEYWANEFLNASEPYINTTPRDRRNDYGFTFGGPLSIPRKYDGRNKTLFFLSLEQFRQENIYEQAFTVPTQAFRNGDFRKILTGRRLGTDPLGRAIMEGMIYDPRTERLISGRRIRDPFPSNIIPTNRFDTVSVNIQNLIPLPTDTSTSQVVDNYLVPWRSPRRDTIGSFKIDQNFSRSKISFYFGINDINATQSLDQGGDGFTSAVTSSKPTDASSNTWQLNYDRVMSPTKILHLGINYLEMKMRQTSAYGSFDQESGIGLTGATFASFPYISGLNASMGGMKDMGANTQAESRLKKPSFNASLSWIRQNHSFKFGAEVRYESYPTEVAYPAYGSLNFSAEQTTLPSTLGQNLRGGSIGFPYASFLLGLANRGDIGVVSSPELKKHSMAFFAQDSWKMTPKLTVEIGLRWDYQTYLKETDGRLASFSSTALNPDAGNLPGALIFEGSGEGHCNCDFAQVYPYAFGPRIGAAYMLTPRTIIRGGAGVIYGQTATDNGTSLISGSTNPFYSTSYANPALKLSSGFPGAGTWPDFEPNQILLGSGVSPMAIDHNAGRPPRQIQWSFGIQREFFDSLVLEAAYVGNRGVWWESNGLVNVNAITNAILAANDLDITVAADRQLLTSTLNSSLAAQNGFSRPPYAGFPLTQTVAQSLRPFPQFGDITYRWAPLGNTWYDAFQARATKRFAHGFEFVAGFTWQKELASGMENVGGSTPLEAVNNIFNPTANKHISALSRPMVGYIAPSFQLPKFSGKKIISYIASDWRFAGYVQYASGLPIRVPTSNSNLYSLIFQTTFANRVEGKGLFTKDLNDDSFNPMSEFALNEDAWRDPAAGEFGTSSAYYDDYRFRRRPFEQFSVGRIFKLIEGVQLSIRADFQNILNRRDMADPFHTNAGATQVKDDDGVPQSGFGFVNYKVSPTNPRNGMIIMKLLF